MRLNVLIFWRFSASKCSYLLIFYETFWLANGKNYVERYWFFHNWDIGDIEYYIPHFMRFSLGSKITMWKTILENDISCKVPKHQLNHILEAPLLNPAQKKHCLVIWLVLNFAFMSIFHSYVPRQKEAKRIRSHC